MPEPIASITCPRCYRTSYNLNDVERRYCGFCHRYHGDIGEWIEIYPPDEEGDTVVSLKGRPSHFLSAHGKTLSEALARLSDLLHAVEVLDGKSVRR